MSFSSAFSVLSKKRPFLTVSFLAGALLTLNACSSAPRGLAHQAHRPTAVNALRAQSADVSSFALQVGAMVVGESQHFYASPLGSVTVTALNFYTSGLGEQCRKAQASGTGAGGQELFAVCERADGVWVYIAPLTQEDEV